MTHDTRNYVSSSLLIATAAVLWAGGYLLRKKILYGISPLLLTFLTAFIVSIVFGVIFRITPAKLLHAFRKAPLLYLLLALTGVVLGSTSMFVALDHLDLGVTVLLEKLQPIFTALFAYLLLNERLAPRKYPYVAGAFVASYLVSVPDPFHLTLTRTSTLGIIAVVAAALSWGAASVIGKQITKIESNSRIITIMRFQLGAVMLLPCFLLRSELGLRLDLNPYILGTTTLCAIFSTGLGYLLFYRGLRGVSATVSGFIELLTPVTGVILGVILLNEELTAVQAIAAVVLLLCAYQLCRPPEKAKGA